MSKTATVSTPEALFEILGKLLERVIEYGPFAMPEDERKQIRAEGLAAIREFRDNAIAAARPAAKEE